MDSGKIIEMMPRPPIIPLPYRKLLVKKLKSLLKSHTEGSMFESTVSSIFVKLLYRLVGSYYHSIRAETGRFDPSSFISDLPYFIRPVCHPLLPFLSVSFRFVSFDSIESADQTFKPSVCREAGRGAELVLLPAGKRGHV